MNNKKAIGMFDSGVGGLTVMQQVMKTLPSETIIYFGDTARLPYGEKSRETIIRYSIENAIFLMEQEIKILVIPCNTASAYAIESLKKIFNIPVLGVIEPGAEKAAKTSKTGRIAVLGTKGTIQSGVYQKEILKQNPEAEIFPVACPLLVPLVEERFFSHPATDLIVKEYLAPLKKQNIDTLLLGCTHYPLLADMIKKHAGEDVAIVDSAKTCAEKVAALLADLKLSAKHPASYKYFVSDDPEKFKRLGKELLDMPIDHVQLAKHF